MLEDDHFFVSFKSTGTVWINLNILKYEEKMIDEVKRMEGDLQTKEDDLQTTEDDPTSN